MWLCHVGIYPKTPELDWQYWIQFDKKINFSVTNACETGVSSRDMPTITHIRKIMNRLGLLGKMVQRVHVNRTSICQIRRWQQNATRRTLRLEKQGFATVIFDEAIFVDDPQSGVKYCVPSPTTFDFQFWYVFLMQFSI